MLASRGQRETGSGAREAIDDEAAASQVRLRARRVWLMVAVATVAAGAAALLARHPL